jgi:hypothetical protein
MDKHTPEPVAKYSDIVSDGGMDPRNKFDVTPVPQSAPVVIDAKMHEILHRALMRSGKVITPPAPQPPREWIGLTESKIDNLLLEHGLMEQWPTQKQIHAFVKAIDQALKEKNHG